MERTRIGPSKMTFVNRGYSGENEMAERRTELSLSSSRLQGDDESGHRARNACEPQARATFHGIRSVPEERSQSLSGRHIHRDTGSSKQTKHCNYYITTLTIVILLAPIGISVYVFWKHLSVETSKCPNPSVDPSISPSMQQDQTKYSELKNLVEEVKKLHQKYQELQTRGAQSGGSSPGESIRDQRKARQNCSSRANPQHETSISELRKTLTEKANYIKMMCVQRIKILNRKINTICAGQQEETSVCIFKMKNSTEVDNLKGRQKVQLNEEKNSASHFVGVTCCSEYYAWNVSNSILQVNETLSNISYTCYCAERQNCSLCYWRCGEETTPN